MKDNIKIEFIQDWYYSPLGGLDYEIMQFSPTLIVDENEYICYKKYLVNLNQVNRRNLMLCLGKASNVYKQFLLTREDYLKDINAFVKTCLGKKYIDKLVPSIADTEDYEFYPIVTMEKLPVITHVTKIYNHLFFLKSKQVPLKFLLHREEHLDLEFTKLKEVLNKIYNKKKIVDRIIKEIPNYTIEIE